jgi:hypothetical protein
VADHRGSDARRGLNRLAKLKPLFDVFTFELMNLPRTDPVVINISLHRRIEVAHHDPDLHRLGKNWFVHSHIPNFAVLVCVP